MFSCLMSCRHFTGIEFLIAVSESDGIQSFLINDNEGEPSLKDCSHSFGIFPFNSTTINIQEATGRVLYSTENDEWIPLICGGGKECFALCDPYAITESIPDNVVKMSLPRAGAASLVVEAGKSLWVTGGSNNAENSNCPATLTSGTELISNVNGRLETSSSDSFLLSLSHHCLETISPTIAIVIGGMDAEKSEEKSGKLQDKSWLIHAVNTMDWTSERQMQVGRAKAACGVLVDQANPEKRIVVAAGGIILAVQDDPMTMTTASVDVLVATLTTDNLDLDSHWNYGPNLPEAIHGASGLTSADQSQFYVLGGAKVSL